MKTPITEMFDIEFPIVAFTHCRDVVAAVSKAGGLGVLGAVGHGDEALDHCPQGGLEAVVQQALHGQHGTDGDHTVQRPVEGCGKQAVAPLGKAVVDGGDAHPGIGGHLLGREGAVRAQAIHGRIHQDPPGPLRPADRCAFVEISTDPHHGHDSRSLIVLFASFGSLF